MRWPRLNLPTDRRIRLISIAGSAILVVLIATSAAVLLNSGEPGGPGATNDGDPLGLQTAAQSGQPASSSSPQVRPTTSAAAQPTASPRSGATGGPAAGTSAIYKTLALLGLGGFDTEVTVSNPGRTSWKVLLTMPADKPVENRSGSLVEMEQQGTTVMLTPTSVSAETVTFIVRFPALLALGKSITACTIDGKACSAS